jgi:hypothetical protein
LEICRRQERLGRRKPRSLARPYTAGELNKTVDAFLHPLAKVDPWFLVLDGILHGLIEGTPSEPVVKFIQHNLPALITELSAKRNST